MKLLDSDWNPHLNKYQNVWLFDNDTGITADFDPDSAEGSVIMVISTRETWIKNSQAKWQRCGSSDVK